MVKRITVQGVPRQDPDVRLFVLALIEFARETAATEANGTADTIETSGPSATADTQRPGGASHGVDLLPSDGNHTGVSAGHDGNPGTGAQRSP